MEPKTPNKREIDSSLESMFDAAVRQTQDSFEKAAKRIRLNVSNSTDEFDASYKALMAQHTTDVNDDTTQNDETLNEYKKSSDTRIMTSLNSVTKDAKDPNRAHTRKHSNSVAKEYQHKNDIVAAVKKSNGQRLLAGAPLNAFLDDNNMSFEDGKNKRVGNSNVEISMSIGVNGPQGLVRIYKESRYKQAFRKS